MSGSDSTYMTLRIVDACLRENVFGIADATVADSLPVTLSEIRHEIRHKGPFLKIAIASDWIYLPVAATGFMQRLTAAADYWLVADRRGWRLDSGYRAWLALLGEGRDRETRDAIAAYCQEADTAVAHRAVCRDAYREQCHAIATPLHRIASWQRRMLLAEQVASFLDHPFYPTARAKHGIDDSELRYFAPEFQPSFSLHWLAVDRSRATQLGSLPACWPSFAAVGLPTELARTHALFPVHPLTWKSLTADTEGTVRAPLTAVSVNPTLSVRTVAVESHPDVHIKLPLTMRTLGAKNQRTIKPSTLYDGHLMAQLLTRIEAADPQLSGRYCHCDEETGGHLGEDRQLAYIVRRYPRRVQQGATLVPVAALASPMPDKRLFLQQLADMYYNGDINAWLEDYLELLLAVHLRLWLVYGIALEANQQNAVLVYEAGRAPSLLMKDNDSARLLPARCLEAMPEVEGQLAAIRDRRILVDDDLALAQMFCTITLQLNIAAPLEAMIDRGLGAREPLYERLRLRLRRELAQLAAEGVETGGAERLLFCADRLYVKYLLSAGSLFSKARSGASDINKYYGLTAPNFLRG